MRFLDTNVLLYAVSTDPSETAKADVANRLLRDRDLCLSVQVLGEFYVQATRTGRPDPLTHRQAADLVIAFGRFPTLDCSPGLVHAAMEARHRFSISYWDAAIVEAARAWGCGELLTEDLSHGQDYGGVLVTDPFR